MADSEQAVPVSIYATCFTLHDDDEHDRKCARHVLVKPGEQAHTFWIDGDETGYDPDQPCTCGALLGPYEYLGSHLSIQGPDHPRSGYVGFARAVGTWTMRFSLNEEDVLLDRRQVEALRDALTEFLNFWDDPADYHRETAYDAALPETPEQLAERKRRHAEFEQFMAGLKAIRESS